MINKKIAILFIPGVGKSEKAFKNCKKMGDRLGYKYSTVNWQQDVEAGLDNLMELHTTYGTRMAKKARRALYDTCGEAVCYQHFKDRILTRVCSEYLKLSREGYDEIIVIAYSWGSVIGYDFIKECIPRKVKRYVTLATPLPLATAGKYNPLLGIHWINIWENSDGIAHQTFKQGIKDIQINMGLIGLTLISHISYLKSKRCVKLIQKELRI